MNIIVTCASSYMYNPYSLTWWDNQVFVYNRDMTPAGEMYTMCEVYRIRP